jgi:hypothetical protein
MWQYKNNRPFYYGVPRYINKIFIFLELIATFLHQKKGMREKHGEGRELIGSVISALAFKTRRSGYSVIKKL